LGRQPELEIEALGDFLDVEGIGPAPRDDRGFVAWIQDQRFKQLQVITGGLRPGDESPHSAEHSVRTESRQDDFNLVDILGAQYQQCISVTSRGELHESLRYLSPLAIPITAPTAPVGQHGHPEASATALCLDAPYAG
jgi:hypothetical protein